MHYQLGLGELFTIFFIMVGPLGLIGHFATVTRSLPRDEVIKLSWASACLSYLTLLVGAFLGRALLMKWHIPIPVMMFTAGIIFFMVAKRSVMAQYQEAPASGAVTGGIVPPPNPLTISYPHIVSPYGIATIIVLMAISHSSERVGQILAAVTLVLILNLLTMLYAQQILRTLKPVSFRILGAALGVLQMALAIAILVEALQMWKLMPS